MNCEVFRFYQRFSRLNRVFLAFDATGGVSVLLARLRVQNAYRAARAGYRHNFVLIEHNRLCLPKRVRCYNYRQHRSKGKHS